MHLESQNRLKQLVIELGISEAQFVEHTGLFLNELGNEGDSCDTLSCGYGHNLHIV